MSNCKGKRRQDSSVATASFLNMSINVTSLDSKLIMHDHSNGNKFAVWVMYNFMSGYVHAGHLADFVFLYYELISDYLFQKMAFFLKTTIKTPLAIFSLFS